MGVDPTLDVRVHPFDVGGARGDGEYDSAPGCQLTVDTDRIICVCDCAGAAILGWKADELLGRSLDDFIEPADAAMLARRFGDVAAGHREFECEAGLRRSDGRPAAFEIDIAPVRSPAGAIEAFQLRLTEVTPLRRARRDLAAAKAALAEQLQDTERLHKISLRLVDSGDLSPIFREIMSVAIAITRADAGNMMLVNESTGEWVTKAQVGLSDSFHCCGGQLHPDAADMPCHRAVTTGKRVVISDLSKYAESHEVVHVRALLAEGISAVESTPLIARSGRILGVISTHYRVPTRPDDWALQRLDLLARQAADLIERAHAHLALRTSEERLRGFLETEAVLTSVIEISEDDYVYVQPNDRMAAFFGMKAADLTGRSARSLGIPTTKIAECLAQFRRCAQTRDAISAEYAFPFGETVHWYAGTMSFLNEGPRGPQFILTLVDVSDRKRAEAALRASENRYRMFVDNATDALFLHDSEGRVVDVNIQACTSLGYERDELIGVRPVAFDPKVSEDQLIEIRRRLRAGERLIFDTVHQHKDGRSFPVEIRANRFEINGVSYDLALVRDITERKRAEEALARSESRFRGAIENIPDVIVIYDRDLRIQYINAATQALTGRTPDDYIGKRDEELWPASVHETYMPTLRAALETGIPQSLDTDIRLPAGDVKSLFIHCIPLLDASGAVHEIVAITHDLTDRKRAERVIRESEQRFSGFMENLPGLAWIKDADGRYVYANEDTASRLGVSKSEILGRRDVDLVPLDVASEFLVSDRHVLSSGKGIQLYECRANEHGQPRHALISKFPISLSEGTSAFVGGVAIDVTERMEAEETIRRIVDGIAPTTGRDFFRALATHLTDACQVEYAFVSRVDRADPLTLHSIAVCSHGELIENGTFDIRGTPCEHVTTPGISFVEKGVREAYPDDVLLDQLGVESYMGASLFSSGGEPLGVVALMHTQPIAKSDQARAILRVVAARAAAELERERAQAELDRTRLEYDFLAESFPSTVFRADALGRAISVNDARWMRLTGGAPGGWSGHGWLDAVHDDDRLRVVSSWRSFVASGAAWSEEFRFCREDGGCAWVRAEAVPMRDPSGAPVEFFGAFIDITHLIETKQALRLTQFSVDQASIAVFWVDRSGAIRYANDWACKSVGYARAELLGMSMMDLADHSPDSWNTRFENIKRMGCVRLETRHRRKDGSDFPVEVTINYVRFGGEEFLLGFANDVTERKKVEDRIEQQSAELAHVSRLSVMGQMVATLSHELAQPLSAVANYSSACMAHLADEKESDPLLAEYLDGISRQANRAGEILRRVRDFVRNTAPRKAVFDLNPILDDSLALMANEFRRRQTDIRRQLSESSLSALVDRVQIQQVIINLLTNARDAVSEPAASQRVVIARSIERDGAAILEIEDSGVGLSDVVRERLFDPFVTTKESGMGIGLSICRSIVESHGGRIETGKGELGGALFRVILPLAEEARHG
ncbi:MAG TPA: PAS domain S-box protein [Phycisphaerae bacterium]|nr:PAS domain S-box protein [Phycisphaerae bacterium]HRW54779.1 PAS domain S-box protein [Phycisphaerae bacterium]